MNNYLLISIKTKYANQIFSGTKTFEFRKKSIGPKNCNKKIFVYSSGLEKAIIGYIIVDFIIEGNIDYIINTTNSNIDDISLYFTGCNKGYALHIKETKRFFKPISLTDIKNKYNNFSIPQFYRYVKEEEPIYNELINTSYK